MSSGSAKLTIERQGHVMVLTVDEPATRNALFGESFFQSFEDMVTEANADLHIRAAILTGAGLAFSSGGNVHEMQDRQGMFGGTPNQIIEQYRTGIQRIPRALNRLDVPLIAAVNGPAIGAGCDLACMCDMRIASERAVFAESFVKVGIVSGDGGAWFLPRIVGVSKAAEMALTGAMVDASEALAMGLVSRVVAPDDLMAEAMKLAEKIAQNPPQVLRWNKRLLREAQAASLDSILNMAAAYQALAHTTEDHTEAVAAIIEKRAPIFKGC
ncbi:crotonase/enoyl-CoA hydratase family protein [uncultured Cohaesibacter sp.]|uniref:crotonase/enoyl-CoA hydratase family protein n=1 Tax=uncultured Cohaesibacter sp. TaxID=1002546 RepID=UPI0029C8D963|nr:crotonase/enoyl-CoA hydratase family protein [uncultured Cohaesibacter sp.]